jgi:hypothetical protein
MAQTCYKDKQPPPFIIYRATPPPAPLYLASQRQRRQQLAFQLWGVFGAIDA